MRLFRCDDCALVEEQGTVTGGTPPGWTVAYESVVVEVPKQGKSKASTKKVTHATHYCRACAEKRAEEREARKVK